jgi:hypothetical protein
MREGKRGQVRPMSDGDLLGDVVAIRIADSDRLQERRGRRPGDSRERGSQGTGDQSVRVSPAGPAALAVAPSLVPAGEVRRGVAAKRPVTAPAVVPAARGRRGRVRAGELAAAAYAALRCFLSAFECDPRTDRISLRYVRTELVWCGDHGKQEGFNGRCPCGGYAMTISEVAAHRERALERGEGANAAAEES